jgi:hypothetical protein
MAKKFAGNRARASAQSFRQRARLPARQDDVTGDADVTDSEQKEKWGFAGDPPSVAAATPGVASPPAPQGDEGNEGFSATKSDRNLPLFPWFFVRNLNH